jgi:mevalonate kinase
MNQMESPAFRKMIKEQFIAYSDSCVEDFLKGDVKSLFGNLKQLSGVVLKHFKPMIPKKFHTLWQQGIETNAYYLKLCGSGGGGYMLGFTQDIKQAQNMLKDHRLEVVYTF